MSSSRIDYVGNLGDPYASWNEKYPELPWSESSIGLGLGKGHPLDDWLYRIAVVIRDKIPEIAENKRKKHADECLEELASRVARHARKLLIKELKEGTEKNEKAKEYFSRLTETQKAVFLKFYHPVADRGKWDWGKTFNDVALDYLKKSQDASSKQQDSYFSRINSLFLYLTSLFRNSPET